MRTIHFAGIFLLLILTNRAAAHPGPRTEINFNSDWKFRLDSVRDYSKLTASVPGWRSLNVPHDWSIEMPFDSTSPTGTGGGALRGGLGWYTKEFTLPLADQGKKVSIHFDGVYCRSSVWLNGQLLGYRPNGYVSFSYDLTPFLRFGKKNLIVVKVNNNEQPNSRWYSGSGIYRKVWLQKTSQTAVAEWGSYITSNSISKAETRVNIRTTLTGARNLSAYVLKVLIYDAAGKQVSTSLKSVTDSRPGPRAQQAAAAKEQLQPEEEIHQAATIMNPRLWSTTDPHLYKAVTQIQSGNTLIDEYVTMFGIRSFNFDVDNGFFLNGKPLKIRGVCNHHDLGSLGTAFNHRAAERQLEILKAMGCNGIRTAHNPPAPGLLDLCDKMGFIVMNEAFDMWEKSKNRSDYSLEFKQWHKRDLEDQVKRDRNHASVFMWSVGNEVGEQWGDSTDGTAKRIITDLVEIVKQLDSSRLTVTANNEVNPTSRLLRAGMTDMVGYNYNHRQWEGALSRWGRKPFIVTESVSALQTRGHYDMPSDSMRLWPTRWDIPLTTGNPDLTCSAYENCYTPWGSSHEQALQVFEKMKHVSGMYVWTGFDYLGEPTPYPWPARSSYFGIIDLAGFPKDAYYLYQSVWTSKPVLHIFPHWNWTPGKAVDVWAYYNNADEVELFLNGKSLGTKSKKGDELHISWRVNFEPGTIKAISRKRGKIVLEKEISTAGKAAKIMLTADRSLISNGGDDLSFITAKIVDANGVMVPDATNQVTFKITGSGTLAATDNGSQTSLESFQSPKRKAFNGMCLAIVRGSGAGEISVTASANGVTSAALQITVE
ncbi:MAG: glycoside hydrolase family 2 TIM barrel-domain containing protein [Ferruginibacter sp.]|nr:glycoside hydrolase family 2 TIM barrel-domain containing protein [Ferruginibacter sp.]